MGPPRWSHITTNPGRLSHSLPRPYVTHDPMLGRPGKRKPVFIWNRAGAWLFDSQCIERMTHSSSAHLATSGNFSETSIPDWPYFLKVYGLRKAVGLVSFGLK